MDLFVHMFSFWCIASVLKWAGAVAVAMAVLWVWGRLWNKRWAAAHRLCWGLSAFFVSLPMVAVLHAEAAEHILSKGPRIFELRVARAKDSTIQSFLKNHAKKCADADTFYCTVIPEYAESLLKDDPLRYLPIEFSAMDAAPDDKKLQGVLKHVYRSRNSSEEALDANDCEQFHQQVKQYLAAQQFEQREEALEEMSVYSAKHLFTLCLLIAFIICAYSAYRDIDQSYCAPYPYK